MALKFLSISATTDSKQFGLDNAKGVTIKNDGTADIYFRLFKNGEEPAAATSAYGLLKQTDSALSFADTGGFSAITVVTGSSTATVRVYYI